MERRSIRDQYYLQRWLQRFETAWGSIVENSLFGFCRNTHLKGISNFSSLFSSAVERHKEYTVLMERDDEVWWQVYFFGSRALGCEEVSSTDAWNLARDFPYREDFPFQAELIQYASPALSKIATPDDLSIECDRILSVLRFWNVGMHFMPLCDIAPQCIEHLIDALAAYSYPNPATRYRILKHGIGHCLEICEIATDALESPKETRLDEKEDTVVYDAALIAHRLRTEQLRGFLFAVESRKKLDDSWSQSFNQKAWRSRFADTRLVEIPEDGISMLSEEEVAYLEPILDEFIGNEIESNKKDIMQVLTAIDSGEKEPMLDDVLILSENLKHGHPLTHEILANLVLRLDEEDQAEAMAHISRLTLEIHIMQLEMVLGECIPLNDLDMSDIDAVDEKLTDFIDSSTRHDQLMKKIIQDNEIEKQRRKTLVTRLDELAAKS